MAIAKDTGKNSHLAKRRGREHADVKHGGTWEALEPWLVRGTSRTHKAVHQDDAPLASGVVDEGVRVVLLELDHQVLPLVVQGAHTAVLERPFMAGGHELVGSHLHSPLVSATT